MSGLTPEPRSDSVELIASPHSATLHTGLQSPSAASEYVQNRDLLSFSDSLSSSPRWTAEIYISADPESKRVSFFPLHDLLENFMTPDLNLVFRKFLNAEDLIFVLPACIRGLQLLEVRPESGMTDIRTLSTYMLKRGLVSGHSKPIQPSAIYLLGHANNIGP